MSKKFKFCKAPFGSIYVRPNARANLQNEKQTEISFCCVQTEKYMLQENETVSDFWKSDWAKEHRQQFLNKEWPSSCSYCEWKERNNVESDIGTHQRITINEYNISNGNELGKPKYVDYRPDNLCNLMCTMCGPSNSNLIEDMWREIPINPDWHFEANKDITDNIINDDEGLVTKELIGSHTMQLKVLGGEPTINKKVHSVFQYAIDKGYAENIDLKITTNFTNVNRTYDMFDKFKSCKIQASIDATGPTYDYIRRPAKWSAVKGKLLEFADRYENSYPKMQWNFNVVWQLANCFTVKDWLPELFDMFYDNPKLKKITKQGVGLSLINCDGMGITLEAIPDSMKHYIINDLEKLLQDWKHNALAFKDIETLIKYTNNSEFTEQQHRAFKRKFMLMDQYKKTNMFELSPRFKELYDFR